MKKKHALLLVVPAASIILTGCLDDWIGFSCGFMSDDPDHCYQSAAVQRGDPDECERIQGTGFTGSNPPRDKCYLQIAENTGRAEVCKRIQGGMMSYTKEECLLSVAEKFQDPSACAELKGQDLKACKEAVGESITADKLKEISDEVEKAKSEAGANPDDKEAQERLAALLAKQKSLIDFAPDSVKADYIKKAREEIMEDIEDEDVKLKIAQLVNAYRQQNPNADPNDVIKKIQEVKDQQETVKRLDDEVNGLFDGMKENLTDFVTEKADEATGASDFAKDMQKRGVEWFKQNGGDRVKQGIENLEWLKGKYDKASEQYQAISGQIEKLQKAYNEAAAVYKKIDDINKLVAEGRIDRGKARVLHGAVFLGKGLEFMTGYVPVFGSTVSKITKETFDATVKFATKRAQRTTAIDKCIEDPLNCDPTGITPY